MKGSSHHIPILLDPIVDFLVEGISFLTPHEKPGVILDCTLGGGGHTAKLLERLALLPNAAQCKVVATDQDPDAIARAKIKFAREIETGRLEIHHTPFSRALDAVAGRIIYGLLADLGVSSDQIDSESRGFSFRYAAPLDMRMDTSRGEPLSQLLEHISETELADLIWKYGEERQSRKIARRIIDRRDHPGAHGEFPKDTKALADLIASSFPPKDRHGRIHPATRTFQALRIAINHELEELEALIGKIFPAVAENGRIAILSFHSLEDRQIKEEMRKRDEYELPSRRAIQASDDEVDENSRSRSARLRLAIKKRRVTLK